LDDLMPGLFLSLDGIDGTGKSTQCRLLAQWLQQQGHHVVECKDPGGTAIGDIIRSILLDHHHEMTLASEAFLFMASRAQLTAEVIRPALEAGHIVLADRYLLANVVYQGHAGGLDVDLLWNMGRLATDGLEPDLTIVLDLSLEVAQSRRRRPADRLESRAAAYQAQVREGFLAEARRRPERIHIVDASPSVHAVQQSIQEEVARVLAAHPRT
jgi:dTMP kinase